MIHDIVQSTVVKDTQIVVAKEKSAAKVAYENCMQTVLEWAAMDNRAMATQRKLNL